MGSISAAISRNRQQSDSKSSYSPDLEYTGQQYSDLIGGRGSPYGGVGMSGGQYVGSQATQGFGTNRFGDKGQQYFNPNTASGNVWGSDYGTGAYPGSQGNPYTSGSSQYPGSGAVYGSPQSGAGPNGMDSPSGYQQGPYQGSQQAGPSGPIGGDSMGAGGGWRPGGYGNGQQPGGGFGGGAGGGSGYGGYGAMQPYQFGSGGAAGDTSATGAAAYGGYNQLNRAYGRLGSQGVTGQERANLMSASNEAIQSNANAYRDQIMNRAGASGNYAGTAGALARLGASSGQNLVNADRQNQIAIMQENQRRKEAGLAGQAGVAQGQAGLYGTSAGYTSGLLAGRAGLAKLKKEDYTSGAGTGGTVSGSGSFGG